jgi:hypothetical protein
VFLFFKEIEMNEQIKSLVETFMCQLVAAVEQNLLSRLTAALGQAPAVKRGPGHPRKNIEMSYAKGQWAEKAKAAPQGSSQASPEADLPGARLQKRGGPHLWDGVLGAQGFAQVHDPHLP